MFEWLILIAITVFVGRIYKKKEENRLFKEYQRKSSKRSEELFALREIKTGFLDMYKERCEIVALTVHETESSEKRDHSVYHIRRKGLTDIVDGYIGVTNNINRRRREHFEALEKRSHSNSKLQRAYYMYELEMVVLKSGLTKLDAYSLEHDYRTVANIGWNKQIGGICNQHFFQYEVPNVSFKISGSLVHQRAMLDSYFNEIVPRLDKMIKERLDEVDY